MTLAFRRQRVAGALSGKTPTGGVVPAGGGELGGVEVEAGGSAGWGSGAAGAVGAELGAMVGVGAGDAGSEDCAARVGCDTVAAPGRFSVSSRLCT